jgi:acyl-CoA synthetase (AMP-forming)/AMP-acid ligase II
MTPSDGASIASKTVLGLIQAIPAEQTAVVAPEQNIRLTYGGLRKQLQDVAEALAAPGVDRDDRIGIALPNGLPNIVTFLAASLAGTAAPLNPSYKCRRRGRRARRTARRADAINARGVRVRKAAGSEEACRVVRDEG